MWVAGIEIAENKLLDDGQPRGRPQAPGRGSELAAHTDIPIRDRQTHELGRHLAIVAQQAPDGPAATSGLRWCRVSCARARSKPPLT